MSITVVGSIAYDGVTTPFGERERMLGGAATHVAVAASFFDQVRPVGPVGEDFADEDLRTLALRGTDINGVERIKGAKRFSPTSSPSCRLRSLTSSTGRVSPPNSKSIPPR